ncbi:MAG: GNAT family N-acetyltransferase [Nitrospinae bacterium]|nr:GNAT family N-acetyltransferase [Nitrospinota bacterium]
MATWEVLSENSGADAWDSEVLACEDAHVYQSHAWGESQRAFGWKPARYLCRRDDGSVAALAQTLIKNYPGRIKIGWSPGGPLFHSYPGKSCDVEEILNGLGEKIAELGGKIFVRFDSYIPLRPGMEDAFSKAFSKPSFDLNSRLGLRFDLRESMQTLETKMSGDVRANLKKASRTGFQWKIGNEEALVQDLMRLYGEMLSIKRADGFWVDHGKVPAVCRGLRENALIVAGYLDGEPVSSSLILRFGDRAVFRERATGARGRRLSASHAAVYKALQYLKEDRVRYLDWVISPADPNVKGVDDFKKGFGGQPIEFLGEWDWSNSTVLRWVVNATIWVMKRRQGKMAGRKARDRLSFF